MKDRVHRKHNLSFLLYPIVLYIYDYYSGNPSNICDLHSGRQHKLLGCPESICVLIPLQHSQIPDQSSTNDHLLCCTGNTKPSFFKWNNPPSSFGIVHYYYVPLRRRGGILLCTSVCRSVDKPCPINN